MADMFPEDVTLVREKFPVGTAVEFVDSTDDECIMRRGDCGVVFALTFDGDIVVAWDRGFQTTVVPGRDSIEIRHDYWTEDD